MSMSDPIADMLTRIRNAQSAGEKKVSMPSSKFKKAILNVLKEEGYILSFDESAEGKKQLTVELKYYEGKPVISKIQRVSRAGLRVYTASDEVPVVSAGMGVAILSTSKGVMTGTKAQMNKLGGEILCVVE